jgi:hypothetical protein
MIGTLFNIDPKMIATPTAFVNNCEKHDELMKGTSEIHFVASIPHIHSANSFTKGMSISSTMVVVVVVVIGFW